MTHFLSPRKTCHCSLSLRLKIHKPTVEGTKFKTVYLQADERHSGTCSKSLADGDVNEGKVAEEVNPNSWHHKTFHLSNEMWKSQIIDGPFVPSLSFTKTHRIVYNLCGRICFPNAFLGAIFGRWWQTAFACRIELSNELSVTQPLFGALLLSPSLFLPRLPLRAALAVDAVASVMMVRFICSCDSLAEVTFLLSL